MTKRNRIDRQVEYFDDLQEAIDNLCISVSNNRDHLYIQNLIESKAKNIALKHSLVESAMFDMVEILNSIYNQSKAVP